MDSATLPPIPLWVPITLLAVLIGGWIAMNLWGEWRDSRDASRQAGLPTPWRDADKTWAATDSAAGYESAGVDTLPSKRPPDSVG